jgi:hypothetical protein
MEETKLETGPIARAPHVQPASVILAQLAAQKDVSSLLPGSFENSIKFNLTKSLQPMGSDDV